MKEQSEIADSPKLIGYAMKTLNLLGKPNPNPNPNPNPGNNPIPNPRPEPNEFLRRVWRNLQVKKVARFFRALKLPAPGVAGGRAPSPPPRALFWPFFNIKIVLFGFSASKDCLICVCFQYKDHLIWLFFHQLFKNSNSFRKSKTVFFGFQLSKDALSKGRDLHENSSIWLNRPHRLRIWSQISDISSFGKFQNGFFFRPQYVIFHF